MVQEMRSVRPARRERRDARANRRRLLDAARAAFAEHGDRISVNEVARAAGVGVGTLYRKYPTKTDLLVALLMELHEELTAEISLRTAATGGDPEAELRGLVEAHLVVLGRVGPLEALLRREAPAAAERVGPGQLTDRFVGPLRAVLERGVTQGVFRPDFDLDLVGRAFFGMLDSRILLPRVERDGVESVARQCTSLLLRGIAAG
jgi:AcrR family transcriptional regulator